MNKGGRKAKTSAQDVWSEYSDGLSFKQGIDLPRTVKQNEDFYTGNQWEGVNAPDLDKPVFNILKRVVSYFISSIVSDDIAVGVTSFAGSGVEKRVLDMLSAQFAEIMELCGFKANCRRVVRDAAVDGDGCAHYWFSPEDAPEDSGVTPGHIEMELLDNTNVFFGNPQNFNVQGQPWVILAFRRRVEDVKETAAEFGGEPAAVQPDRDTTGAPGRDAEEGKATVLRKYWKEEGSVWFCEVVQGGTVRPPTDTGYARYPLAWMCWEEVKNRCHGQAALTGMVPNQIFINKLFAMQMHNVKLMAFPKVIYDRTRFPEGWSNRVGAAIPVTGNPNEAIAGNFRAADMSPQAGEMVEKVIMHTRDMMGASDAALGNIKPENTSAIIATQKATSMPLELQRMAFYGFVEDSVRVFLEIMAENFGVRAVEWPKADTAEDAPPDMPAVDGAMQGQPGAVPGMAEGAGGGLPVMAAPGLPVEVAEPLPETFDFAEIKGMNLRLNVDVGAATYWSELMQVSTLDNLFDRGIISDPELYVELIPAAYIQNKQEVLEGIRAQKAAAAEAAQAEAAAAAPPEEGAGELPPGGDEALMAMMLGEG